VENIPLVFVTKAESTNVFSKVFMSPQKSSSVCLSSWRRETKTSSCYSEIILFLSTTKTIL